jgi:hypothetical protein
MRKLLVLGCVGLSFSFAASPVVRAEGPELTPEQWAVFESRAPEFQSLSEEQLERAQALEAELRSPGDCGQGKSLADCLEEQKHSNLAARAGAEENSEQTKKLNQEDARIDSVLASPEAHRQSARDLAQTAEGIRAISAARDFSLKWRFERVWFIFRDSWRELATPGPLIALSSGVAGWGAGTTLNSRAKEYYSDPSHRLPSPLLQLGTQYGYGYAVIAPWYAVSLFRKKDDRFTRTADALVAGLALNTALTEGLKYAFRDWRPDRSDRLGNPSGHTSTSTLIATVIDREMGHRYGIPAYVMAAFVGLTRIENLKHYPSQVAAGAALGVATGLAVSSAEKKGSQNWFSRALNPTFKLGGREVSCAIRPVATGTDRFVALGFGWR